MTGEKVSDVMHPIVGASDAYSTSNDGIYNYVCYYPLEPEPLYHTFVLLSKNYGLY